jgi:hypothetical protein
MNKKSPGPDQDRKPSKKEIDKLINFVVLSQWTSLLWAVERIEADDNDKFAIFELGAAWQYLSLINGEHGTQRLLKAVPKNHKKFLKAVMAEGPEAVQEAFETGALLFGDMEFPPMDEVLELVIGMAEEMGMEPPVIDFPGNP